MPYKNKEERNKREREFRKENLELVRARERVHYKKNKEKINARKREKRDTDEFREKKREYYRINKDKMREYQKEYREKNRDRVNSWMRKHTAKSAEARRKKHCRYLLNYALSKGYISKKPCVVCGEKNVEAHHDDYSKPYDVIWYCFKHHREHRRRAKINENRIKKSTRSN